jgi:hypothetical protein
VPQVSAYKNLGLLSGSQLRSKLNGIQLAEAVQPRIDEIRGEIAEREQRIAELLG